MGFFLGLCLAIYIGILGCVFVFQRQLMYHPSTAIAPPERYGLEGVRNLAVPGADGLKLQLWAHAPRAGFPTIVYFHGNAGNLSDRAEKFGSFIRAGFGLLALSYPGFGQSEGKPTESGNYAAARAAIAYARDQMRVPDAQLIYFGESLGTGVAVQMATEKPPALLVLEAAYTSVETRSAELYPYLMGVRTLVLDKYDSLSKITRVHAPLLMLHGDMDGVIPLRHGQALFAAANEPKQLVVYPGVHHVDYTHEQIGQPLMATARRIGLVQ